MCVVVAEAAPRTVAMPMYDQWCYYYRLSVVMLFEGLPRGSYTARIWLDELLPTRQFTRRPAPPGIQARALPSRLATRALKTVTTTFDAPGVDQRRRPSLVRFACMCGRSVVREQSVRRRPHGRGGCLLTPPSITPSAAAGLLIVFDRAARARLTRPPPSKRFEDFEADGDVVFSVDPLRAQGPLKLWLSYSLVMRGTWADQSKPLASAAAHEPTLCATLGEERQAVSVVAPLKHEDDLIRRQQGLPGVAFRLEDDAAASSGVSASWAGDGHEMSQRCAGCGTVAAQLGLLRCSRCKVTFYW